jgi:hypothetical protein
MSFCQRNFYLLPADKCVEAAGLFKLAREDAMRAKREIWKDKYGAVGAVTGAGTVGNGLVFDSLAAFLKQAEAGGFRQKERLKKTLDSAFASGDFWLGKPARNTRRGKQIAEDLDYVEELCETWQWALERALGVYGTVYYNHAFHKTVANLLKDGRVIVSAAVDKNRPRSEGVSRNFDATVMPEWAEVINEDQYKALLLEADRFEAEESAGIQHSCSPN